jgi:hypothetical protein
MQRRDEELELAGYSFRQPMMMGGQARPRPQYRRA